MAANPGLAKIIGTLMKHDFQRAVLNRIPRMAQAPDRHWREVLFICDEYHAFATVGEHDPTGDEQFFSLSRQAKCIPIVATQSLSSLRSAVSGDTWRTLVQTFRTKIFLALSDDFSARVASDLCGKEDQLKPQYHLAEAGQDARVSILTGRATAPHATISTSKSYTLQREYTFEPKIFAELKNAQAIVLAYDGCNPHRDVQVLLGDRHVLGLRELPVPLEKHPAAGVDHHFAHRGVFDEWGDRSQKRQDDLEAHRYTCPRATCSTYGMLGSR